MLQHDIGADNLACPRVRKAGAITTEWRLWRRRPAKYVVTNIAGVPIGIVGLNLHLDGVPEPCLLK